MSKFEESVDGEKEVCAGDKEESNNESNSLIWDKSSELYMSARNGSQESFNELEEITNTHQDDLICQGYLLILMKRSVEFYHEEKYSQLSSQIKEKISNLFTENSNYLSTIINRHEQFIFSTLSELDVGIITTTEEIFRLMKLSADQDLTLAECMVGNFYHNGYGTNKDEELSMKYYMKAAMKGHSVAQYNLGLHYEDGFGVTIDTVEAVRWYLMSASQGYISAQNSLGRCYEHNIGVIKDYSQCFYWYKKSADRGDTHARYVVGWCYLFGKGVEKNEEESIKWLKLSADKGQTSAQYFLGDYYIRCSNELQQNEGYELIRKSAENKCPQAQYSLGLQYYCGDRVPVDETEAIKWMKLSAEKGGYWKAMFFIGKCYHYGRFNLQRNHNESFELFNKY